MYVSSDASVNIIFHGLINPCLHLMESHQLYNITVHVLCVAELLLVLCMHGMVISKNASD